jgi:hypothetical protein
VFRKVQSDLDRSILGIGCSAHIVHNSVRTAYDSLPLHIEVIDIKIYKYFHIYTVRVRLGAHMQFLVGRLKFALSDYHRII